MPGKQTVLWLLGAGAETTAATLFVRHFADAVARWRRAWRRPARSVCRLGNVAALLCVTCGCAERVPMLRLHSWPASVCRLFFSPFRSLIRGQQVGGPRPPRLTSTETACVSSGPDMVISERLRGRTRKEQRAEFSWWHLLDRGGGSSIHQIPSLHLPLPCSHTCTQQHPFSAPTTSASCFKTKIYPLIFGGAGRRGASTFWLLLNASLSYFTCKSFISNITFDPFFNSDFFVFYFSYWKKKKRKRKRDPLCIWLCGFQGVLWVD